MPKKKYSNDDLYRKFDQVLSRLEERQNTFLDKSSRTFSTIYGNILGLDSNLNRVSRRFDSILNKALGHSDTLLANFTELTQNALSIATDTFKSILESALNSIGGGGFFSILSGFLSFIPFFQEGGIIKGTRKGTPAIIGERFTTEVILPLEKLENIISSGNPPETKGVVINEGDINIEVKGSLTDRETLIDEVYKAAMTGRLKAMERALGWLNIEEE
ncbi:MAG: hypothetical protein B6D57_04810 [Candidatus Coatesbacteria bacterium 4484_99]|uniref:Uncharacterized protein n=1 Tax=Candidatus Coatesbacteria bacterium 4484_99 TaxID=1970774 RepID=A0A1W9S0F7_9BACT|nr:MAG: hypothetical protein B6D57_04810 [Candidatus Coatesbacteria bacterium 4484_99]RLC42622.1 MAG: hypothetical protein DRH49_03570 [Candidatus Coatesbacteria bacterium]